MAKGRPANPSIRRILGTSGAEAGRTVRSARPGDPIRILGAGFGRRAAAARVLFDDTEVRPFAIPFSDSELIVTCPLPAEGTATLRVRVGRRSSEPVRFRVQRPARPRGRVGDATREFFAGLDEFAAHVAAVGRQVAPLLSTSSGLTEAADLLDGARALNQRSLEGAFLWRELQARASFQPLRVIENLDAFITSGGLTGSVIGLTRASFGPGSWSARMRGSAAGAEAMFASLEAAPAGGPAPATFFGLGGFLLHEASKALEGIENLIKIIGVFSASGSVGAGIEVEIDVNWSPGEGVSAIAKLVDIIAQYLLNGDAEAAQTDLTERLEAIRTGVEMLELKADTADALMREIGQKADRQEVKLDEVAVEQGQKLDALEAKSDRQEQQIADLTATVVANGEKLDTLEVKADRHGELLDALEVKGDRQEEKLDRTEEKADRAEAKLDRLEEKADRAEEKLDRAEEKLDRAEQKLDRLEEKGDRAEEKLDRAEEKLDRLETKADGQEAKLDALETKADRQEGKLDMLEAKADAMEAKLDREEVKLDRLAPPPAPLEGSIANQQGGGNRVTAAVAALRAADNEVYVRAAVNRLRSQLTDPGAWSDWMPFDRPATSFVLTTVSLDLHYQEGSDTLVNALLTARDQAGRVYHRSYEDLDHSGFVEAARWTDWQDFLDQP